MDTSLEDPELEEEGLEVSDDEMYDQEELEIALYSQIHFDDNTDSGFMDYGDPDNDQYDIKVEGNSKTGFMSYKMTSDCILNDQLKGHNIQSSNVKTSSAPAPSQGKSGDPFINLFKGTSLSQNVVDETSKVKPKVKSSKGRESQTEVEITSVKTQEQKQKNSAKKTTMAEKLMLGNNSGSDSESDSDSVTDYEIISSDDGDKKNKEHIRKRVDKGSFIAAFDMDDTDYEGDEDFIDNSDIQFNVIGGALPSSSSDQSEESANEDDWKISFTDSFTDSKHVRQSRYFKPVLCFNCKERGHLSKSCPKPKKQVVCSLCSGLGHTYQNCFEPVCSNCLEIGHTFRRCRMSRFKLDVVCHRCKMEGHMVQKCPDIWRQFHLTIEPNNFVKGKPRRDAPLSCYNCGGDDHLGHECDEERSNRFVRLTTPFVCKYQPRMFNQELASTEAKEVQVESIKSPMKPKSGNGKPRKDGNVTLSSRVNKKRKAVNSDRNAIELNEDYIEILESPKKKRKTKPTKDDKTRVKQHRKKDSTATFGKEQSASIGFEGGNVDKRNNKSKATQKQKKTVSNFVPFTKKQSVRTDRSNPKDFERFNAVEIEQNVDSLFRRSDFNRNDEYEVENRNSGKKVRNKYKKFKNKSSVKEAVRATENHVMSGHRTDFGTEGFRNQRGFKTNLVFQNSKSSEFTKSAELENVQVTIRNNKTKNVFIDKKNSSRNVSKPDQAATDGNKQEPKMKKKKGLKRKQQQVKSSKEAREVQVESIKSPMKPKRGKPRKDGNVTLSSRVNKKRKADNSDRNAMKLNEDYIEILESPKKKRKTKPTKDDKTKVKQHRKKDSTATFGKEQSASIGFEGGNVDNRNNKSKATQKQKKTVSNVVPFTKKQSVRTDRSNPKDFERFNATKNVGKPDQAATDGNKQEPKMKKKKGLKRKQQQLKSASTEAREVQVESIKSPMKPKRGKPRKDGNVTLSSRVNKKRKADNSDRNAIKLNEDYIEILESPKKKRKTKPTKDDKTKVKQHRKKDSTATFGKEQSASIGFEGGNVDKRNNKSKATQKQKKTVSNVVPFTKKQSVRTERSSLKDFERFTATRNVGKPDQAATDGNKQEPKMKKKKGLKRKQQQLKC